MSHRTSRLSGFHKLTAAQRIAVLRAQGWLSSDSAQNLLNDATGGLTQDEAEFWSENNLGTFALPWGACLNVTMDGRDYVVPMVIEEPSVVAAVSFSARAARVRGGFTTSATASHMAAQIQYVNVPDPQGFAQRLQQQRAEIFSRADGILPNLKRRGGGLVDIELRELPRDNPDDPAMHVVHLIVDVQDAMGANLLNTLAEEISPYISELAGAPHLLRILSNLADRRLARASCEIPLTELKDDPGEAAKLAERIELASMFAERDPYRAATHNKGIFNGVDAVVIASGNDWRQVEASCHAYAARSGRYSALASWRYDRAQQLMRGQIELPLALGVVGAQIQGHARTRMFYEMTGVKTSGELARLVAVIGLAQNYGAVRALSDEGIQSGHMRLHARNVAQAAGCPPELIEALVEELIARGNIKIDEAERILSGDWSTSGGSN